MKDKLFAALVDIRRRGLLLTAASAGVLFLLVCVFLTHYFYILSQGFDLSVWRNDKTRFQKLSETVKEVEERLVELGHLDQKLRKLAEARDEQLGTAMESLGPTFVPASLNTVVDPLEQATLDSRLMGLSQESKRQVASLSQLVDHFNLQKTVLAYTPNMMPIRGSISSNFGMRLDPFTGHRAMHMGLDIAARLGTKVVAPAKGRVVYVGTDGLLGNTVFIEHRPGLVSKYGHLDRALVKIGDQVDRGQAIARVGNTGKSTGSHLHYQIEENGLPIDPRKFAAKTRSL